jgi:hypothetical protein
MLKNEGIKNVTIVEPSQTHYYQPLWTLVGEGIILIAPTLSCIRNDIADTYLCLQVGDLHL